jgi:benzodiazapine receptor
MHRLLSLAVFLLLVVIAAAVGGQFVGGDWYQSMNQPVWNPPAIVMASVWAVLYVLMAVSAWMVWDTVRGLARVPLAWWGLQLLLGICWSWMYFGLERIGWTMALMTVWILAVFMVIISFRPIRKDAAGLMIPLLLWLLFIEVLNLVQWLINGGGIGAFF